MSAPAATLVDPFRPQTVTPPAAPLGFCRAIRTVVDNPLKLWPEQLYRERAYISTFGRSRFVHLASPQLAQGVLLDHADAFHRARIAERILKPALGEGLLTAEDEAWRRQRRIAAPAFRVKALRALAPAMGAAGAAAARRLAVGSGLVDVMPAMTGATFDVIVETLLAGGDLDRRPDLREAMARDVGLYIESGGRPDILDIFHAPRWIPAPWKAKGRAAAARLREAARRSVRSARGEGGAAGALTQLLAEAADPETGGRLSEEELIDNLLTFISAGHETTALALTWSLYLLSQAPALQQALAEEAEAILDDGPVSAEQLDALTLHAQVIDEALRLYPPVPVIGRSAQRDVTLEDAEGPLEIRRGDELVVAVYVMHRHHALWEAPDHFRLGRTPAHRFAFMPFGAGPRICIGMKFAAMEAAAILAQTLRRVRVAPGPAREVEPQLRITLRPKGGMPLRISPR